jgi:soluble lytic murein transglycosylase-like protein
MSAIQKLLNRPESFSIDMLQRGMQDGVIPAYIAIPMIAEKVQQRNSAGPAAPAAPPVAAQVLAAANNPAPAMPQMGQAMPMPQAPIPQAPQGVPSLPSNLPVQAASGGIVAFASGGETDDEEDDGEDELDLASMSKEDQQIFRHFLSQMGPGAESSEMMPESEHRPEVNARTPAEAAGRAPREGIERLAAPMTRGMGNHPYESKVLAAAEHYGVDPRLALHVLHKETGGLKNPATAVSPAGAMGVMQLMPATAKQLGVRDPFNPDENIDGGVKYLAQLSKMFNDPKLVAAAYNAGPGNVQKHGGVPPFRETQGYVTGLAHGGEVPSFAGPRGSQVPPEEPSMFERYFNDPYGWTRYANKPKLEVPEGAPTSPAGDLAREILNGPQQGGRYARRLEDEAARKKPGFFSVMTREERAKAEEEAARLKQEAADIRAAAKIPAATTPPPISNTPYPDTAPVRESVKAREKQNADKPAAPTSFKPVDEPAAPTETPYNKLLEKIGASLDKREKGVESSREQDKYLALLQAGLGMMGGTSPYAAANIGQGASTGVAALMASNKQRAAEENSIMAGQLGLGKMGLYGDMHLADVREKALARGDLNAARNADLAQKAAYYAQKLGVDKAKVAAKVAENWAKATKDFEESQFGLGALEARFKKQYGENWRISGKPELERNFNIMRTNAINERVNRMPLSGVQQADDLDE